MLSPATRTGVLRGAIARASLTVCIGRTSACHTVHLASAHTHSSQSFQFSDKEFVGNFGDGQITAFDRQPNGKFEPRGQLRSASGGILTIDGLWALQFGKGALAMRLKALKRVQDALRWPAQADELPVLGWDACESTFPSRSPRDTRS